MNDVKHSMDKSFIVFKSLFYTFTPFFIIQKVLLKLAAQNLLVHWMEWTLYMYSYQEPDILGLW